MNNTFLYGENYPVTSMEEKSNEIILNIESKKTKCQCPLCKHKSSECHEYYIRTVQDTPIHNKTVWLKIKAHKYECINRNCKVKVFTEEIDFSKSDEIPFITFDKMPSISIDYALMEKSDKIALVKLESDWNDLGSWQSIYDVSKKDENGNVFIGHVLDKDSKNSFVYASSKLVATIGLEDTIIVETEDAILACKKDQAQNVKHIYDTLKKQNDNTHLVHKTVYRPWGFYTVIAQGEGFLTKIIHVNSGQKLSLQSHNYRSEHWVVLTGKAKVILEGKELILSPGHSVDIPLKAIHSLQNPFDEGLEVIEVQKGDPLIEEDIIRYEDMYGRV